jgi:hypothetical protein
MVYFQTKNPNADIFGMPLNGTFWYVLRTFGIFKVLSAVWYILYSFGTYFYHFGMLNQEKSGNPGSC